MSDDNPDFCLGIISSANGARNARGRVVCNHSIGRLIDVMRDLVPRAKLCIPILDGHPADMTHEVAFPPEDIVALPPLESVIRSQAYYFQTRRIVRQFARQVDVLFIRLPFQLPMTLRGLKTPKVLHVVGNTYQVVAASSDYSGLLKKLALRYAAHTNATTRRLVAEPHTRSVTNGSEMWDLLKCRDGRVVVSSCMYEREMRPRDDRALGQPPKLLFVGYLRPEKGVSNLLDAFEMLRAKRPLKLTLVGGSDRTSNAEAEIQQRIATSRYREDITQTGLIEFGEDLFELYRSHDMLVLPSLSEGTPRTLVEARSLGCPVVATRVGGIPSSVTDGKNGLLVPPDDSNSLAAAIEGMLNDEALRQRLIDEGLRNKRTHSVEYFAEQLIDEVKVLARQSATANAARGALTAGRS